MPQILQSSYNNKPIEIVERHWKTHVFSVATYGCLFTESLNETLTQQYKYTEIQVNAVVLETAMFIQTLKKNNTFIFIMKIFFCGNCIQLRTWKG